MAKKRRRGGAAARGGVATPPASVPAPGAAVPGTVAPIGGGAAAAGGHAGHGVAGPAAGAAAGAALPGGFFANPGARDGWEPNPLMYNNGGGYNLPNMAANFGQMHAAEMQFGQNRELMYFDKDGRPVAKKMTYAGPGRAMVGDITGQMERGYNQYSKNYLEDQKIQLMRQAMAGLSGQGGGGAGSGHSHIPHTNVRGMGHGAIRGAENAIRHAGTTRYGGTQAQQLASSQAHRAANYSNAGEHSRKWQTETNALNLALQQQQGLEHGRDYATDVGWNRVGTQFALGQQRNVLDKFRTLVS